ncbi:hypothetical protein [Chitinophaga filiformis]|uniref:Uncharacterized protein n=1 Tax=Chitinophaga filiformis TaxID=104663 RepID=A0A1G7M9E7_CHIFI|nr:hypothetical protein [Chitinophaga filiformis]SDF57849.1 hypothetical protein SAMN04488121_102323 [Chitinophaga filiformis]
MNKIVCLTLICSMITGVLYSQTPKEEKELLKAVDQFTNANKQNWDDLEKLMNSLPDSEIVQRTDKFRNAAFVKSFNSFSQKNGDKYAAVRSAKFAQYAPPPPALLALEWDTTSLRTPNGVTSNIDLFSVILLRTFDPGLTAQIANSMFVLTIFSDTTLQPLALRYYRVKGMFGTQLYTRHLSGDFWQVWAADRILAISFRYDVRQGIISAASRTKLDDPAYAKISWPHSIAKPANETVRLMDDLVQSIWDSYPEIGYENEDRYLRYRQLQTIKLAAFHNSNRGRYRKAIEQELRSLAQPPATLTGFKELTTAEDDITPYRDSTYNAATFLYPRQWASAIQMAALSYFQLNPKEYARRVQHTAIFGLNSYARQLNNDEWEVWNVGALDACSYIWDLRTGHASKARYWVQEDTRF